MIELIINNIILLIIININKYLNLSGKSVEYKLKQNIPIFGGIIFFLNLIKNKKINLIIIIASLIGFIDDICKIIDNNMKKTTKGGLSNKIKLTLLIILLLIIIKKYGIFQGINAFILLNGFNFIDGIDGLAGTISLLLLFQTNFKKMVIVILLFLYYNFYPAKIFMGDTGSNILGIIIALSYKDKIRFSNVLLYMTFFESLFLLLGFKYLFGIYPSKRDFLKLHYILENKFSERTICYIFGIVTLIGIIFDNFLKINLYFKILLISLIIFFAIYYSYINIDNQEVYSKNKNISDKTILVISLKDEENLIKKYKLLLFNVKYQKLQPNKIFIIDKSNNPNLQHELSKIIKVDIIKPSALNNYNFINKNFNTEYILFQNNFYLMYPKKIYILENTMNKNTNIKILTNNFNNIFLNEFNFDNNIIKIDNENIELKNIIIRKKTYIHTLQIPLTDDRFKIYKLNKNLDIKKLRNIII